MVTIFLMLQKEECFGQTGHDISALHYDWLKDVAEKVGKDLGEPIGQSRLETFEVMNTFRLKFPHPVLLGCALSIALFVFQELAQSAP